MPDPKSEPSVKPPTADRRLWPALIRINRAYVEALTDTFSEAERQELLDALKQLEGEASPKPEPPTDPGAETSLAQDLDGRLLRMGKAGASKLIVGRGRAEQIAAALRLWLIDEVERLSGLLADVQRALIELAEGHVATLMPGYANARPVQVIACSHWLVSYFWMLARDQDRLSAVIGRASSSPLGSGTLAGTLYRLDRRELAQALDFGGEAENSLDAVTDLDFGAEFLFAATLIGVHLNRLASDLLTFANPALGFVTLDKRPSGAGVERLNARSGRLLGNLTGFLTSLRSLPASFTADTLESRGALYEAADVLAAMLEAVKEAITGLTVHPDRMWEALNESILAGDLVEYLVTRGESYEKATAAVDKLMASAEQSGKPIAERDLAYLQKESTFFDADVFGYLDHSRSAAQRATIGGTAPAAIRAQIRQAMNWLVEAGLE
jgi:argininosuccinate lyase